MQKKYSATVPLPTKSYFLLCIIYLYTSYKEPFPTVHYMSAATAAAGGSLSVSIDPLMLEQNPQHPPYLPSLMHDYTSLQYGSWLDMPRNSLVMIPSDHWVLMAMCAYHH